MDQISYMCLHFPPALINNPVRTKIPTYINNQIIFHSLYVFLPVQSFGMKTDLLNIFGFEIDLSNKSVIGLVTHSQSIIAMSNWPNPQL